MLNTINQGKVKGLLQSSGGHFGTKVNNIINKREKIEKTTEYMIDNIFARMKSVIDFSKIENYNEEELKKYIKNIADYISVLSIEFTRDDNEASTDKETGDLKIDKHYLSMIRRTLQKIVSKSYEVDNDFFLIISTFICFENIKKFYVDNTEIYNEDIDYIRSEPCLNETLYLYIESIIKNKDNKTTDSYEEFGYALYLLGIGNNYDVIDDVKNNELSCLLNYVNLNLKNLKMNSDINEFKLLIDTINQLLVILSEFPEYLEMVYKVFVTIVNKLELFIEEFISLKGIDLSGIEKPIVYVDLIKNLNIELSDSEKINIDILQSLLGKYYGNFSGIDLDLCQYDDNIPKDFISKDMNSVISKIFEYLEHGEKLKNSKMIENESSIKEIEDFKKAERITNSQMFTMGNKAYTNIMSFKKKEKYGIFTEPRIIEENTNSIVEMYKFQNQISSKELSLNDIVGHFVSKEKWTSSDLVCIHSFMLFGEFEPYILRDLVLAIIKDKRTTSSILIENKKVEILSLIVEQIVKKITIENELLFCNVIDCKKETCINPKKQVCHRLIAKVEKYITKNSKNSFVFNYSRLYLSLAYLYSSALNKKALDNSYRANVYIPEKEEFSQVHLDIESETEDLLDNQNESQYSAYWDKTIKYYHYFLEKLGNKINPSENELVKKIKNNTLKNSLPNSMTDEKKSELIMKNERDKLSMKERLDLQSQISDLILEIQTSDIMKENGFDIIKNKICQIIGDVLFKGGCEIQILPKNKKETIGRFQDFKRIEGKDFDIVFIYHKNYEDTFNYIFNQEKDYIQKNISQLVDIHEKYSKAFKYLQTVIGATSVAMGIKDTYTKGHVERVVEFSVMIGKILGLDWNDLFTLKVQAILHDYGKLFIDDDILKKPGKLSWKEIEQMSFHTGKGVEKALEHGFLPELIEGNIHHCKYYSKGGIPDLTYDKVTKQLLEHKKNSPGIPFDYSLFNKLMGNNIPKFARILQLADIKDAIASRRIYEDRAGYTIEEIINTVESEFINCSGLKMNKKNSQLELDKGKWMKAETEEQKNLCYAQKEIDANGEEIIYITNTNYRELGKVDLGFSIEFFNELLEESGLSASLESYVSCKSYKQNLTNDEKQKIRNGLFANDNDGSGFYNVGKDIVKWWGLKLNKETQKIEIDKTKWIEAKTDLEKLHSCGITQGDKIYIPDPNNSIFKESVIEFDPSIVKEVFADPKKVEELRLAIRENDKKEMADKIKEFEGGIELLTKKEKNNIQSNKCMLEELNKADLLLSEFDELNEKLKGVKSTLLQQNDSQVTEFVKYLEGFISDKRIQIAKTYINLNSIMEVFTRHYNFTSEEANNLARMKRILPRLEKFASEYEEETSKTQDS